ncbi:MAG: hypothetical protein JSW58_07400 [Candidatus Latescibacterota bacterium]|nr:MAG: hypothetical protein JSW58_07400 [Candidatus Latescibacterota bacterium]
MKLQNIRPGKANSKVWVNGTLYELDGKGVVEVEDQKDQDELLADISSWRVYVPREPATAPESKPEARPKEKAEVEPVETPGDDPEGDDNPWPDPTMDMEISYLREMAEAYQVTFTKKTPKKALVAKIKKAMYGE